MLCSSSKLLRVSRSLTAASCSSPTSSYISFCAFLSFAINSFIALPILTNRLAFSVAIFSGALLFFRSISQELRFQKAKNAAPFFQKGRRFYIFQTIIPSFSCSFSSAALSISERDSPLLKCSYISSVHTVTGSFFSSPVRPVSTSAASDASREYCLI